MRSFTTWIFAGLALFVFTGLGVAQTPPTINGPIVAASQKLVAAFNAGKPDDVAALFAPAGELVDEAGTAYQGTTELAGLFTRYFKKFPDAKLELNIDSIRQVADGVVIEEGTRKIAGKVSGETTVRYITVHTKVGEGWKIASVREFNADPTPTPGEMLQPLAWLVGEWVSEGEDAVVTLNYRWDESKNYLLADFHIVRNGKAAKAGTQRIGWNPVTRKIHSWVFDADGGFGEGDWTALDNSWVIKSTAVTAEGEAGSSTITWKPIDKNRYTIQGVDRLIGELKDEDFELTIVRKPPTASK